MWSSCDLWCRDSRCSPFHAVFQVNKTKNIIGMILGAYTVEKDSNPLKIWEMLVPDYIDQP
jgi:hypothetical protein